MSNQVTCTRRFEWDAMHRIPFHENQCKAFHGHRYVAEITCCAELDERGRVIDFGLLKSVVGRWIGDQWDHTALLLRNDPDPAVPAIIVSNKEAGRPVYFLDHPPTAENLVVELANVAQQLLAPYQVKVTRVRLWETPSCSAEWILPEVRQGPPSECPPIAQSEATRS